MTVDIRGEGLTSRSRREGVTVHSAPTAAMTTAVTGAAAAHTGAPVVDTGTRG
jgi:hypothetical protein